MWLGISAGSCSVQGELSKFFSATGVCVCVCECGEEAGYPLDPFPYHGKWCVVNHVNQWHREVVVDVKPGRLHWQRNQLQLQLLCIYMITIMIKIIILK